MRTVFLAHRKHPSVLTSLASLPHLSTQHFTHTAKWSQNTAPEQEHHLHAGWGPDLSMSWPLPLDGLAVAAALICKLQIWWETFLLHSLGPCKIVFPKDGGRGASPTRMMLGRSQSHTRRRPQKEPDSRNPEGHGHLAYLPRCLQNHRPTRPSRDTGGCPIASHLWSLS